MIKKLLIGVLMAWVTIFAMVNSNSYVSRVEAAEIEMNSEFVQARLEIIFEVMEISEKVSAEVSEKVEAEKKAEAKRKAEAEKKAREANKWKGEILTASKGVVQGPSGKETYYNLNMSGVVKIMRGMGFSEDKYPYYVREDGVKMLGAYVMCAANLSLRPRGSLVETSLGTALVCDTGGFAKNNPKQIDIAVAW